MPILEYSERVATFVQGVLKKDVDSSYLYSRIKIYF